MELAAMEFAALFGISAIGIILAYQGANRIHLSADIVRLFIGYRLLHEIFIRTEPRINGLPGWAPVEALASLFERLAGNHWPVVGTVIDVAILPYITVWASLFALVHTTVTIGLLAGWRIREVSFLGLGYTGLLISLGFTRYAPFVFGYLFVIMTLSGRYAAFDTIAGRESRPITIGFAAGLVAVTVALCSGLLTLSAGNIPGVYMGDLGVVPTMVFIFASLLAWVSFVQNGGRPKPWAHLSRARSTHQESD